MKRFIDMVNEAKDDEDGEYGQEGAMAKSQLRMIINSAKRLHSMLQDDDELPGHIISDIVLATDYVTGAADYMESEMAVEDDYDIDESVNLEEDTMPSNVAARLQDRHYRAAMHHKKNGNMKGYKAHLDVHNKIEDALIHAGSHMPIRSKRIEAASDKAFKEHPHRVNEETNIDEANKQTVSSNFKGYLRKDNLKVGDRVTAQGGASSKNMNGTVVDVHPHGVSVLRDGAKEHSFVPHTQVKKISEEVEQIDEISDKTKARYLDKAVKQRHDFFTEPFDPKKEPKWTTPKGKPKKGYYDRPEKVKARAKDARRGEIIDKTSKELTGKPHYGFSDANAGDWWKGKKYTKEETQLDEISREKMEKVRQRATKRVALSIGSTEKDPNTGLKKHIPATEDELALARKGMKTFMMANNAIRKKAQQERMKKEDTDLSEAAGIKGKEYHAVHRAASLTSAQIKHPVPGDQPTFHKTAEEAQAHLNKKYEKVREGIWKNDKDQFFFHKKKVFGESVELDEVSKNTLKSYVGKATDQLDADWQDARKGKPGMSNRKVSNRFAGVDKARDRLKNEATDLNIGNSLDSHIASFAKGVKSSAPKSVTNRNDGSVVKSMKKVSTDASHQQIFDHLKKMGYSKTKGYDPAPNTWTSRSNSDTMTLKTDPVHHSSGISAHVEHEHGGKPIVYFTNHKMKEEAELTELSTGTLRGYLDKVKPALQRTIKAKLKGDEEGKRQSDNHYAGIKRAKKKLGESE